MPQLLIVGFKRPQGRLIRIWVPVLPLVLVLSPLLILATLAACLVYRVSVMRAFGAGWRLFCALPGTRVDVREGRMALLVSIR